MKANKPSAAQPIVIIMVRNPRQINNLPLSSKSTAQYGSVIRAGEEVMLASEGGDLQQQIIGEAATSVSVETHFGSGPAEFRVAGLHDFDLEVDAPSHEVGRVRFSAQIANHYFMRLP